MSKHGVFWSAFYYIWTDYGDLICKSPYSVQVRENMDQKNSVFGHFSRSGNVPVIWLHYAVVYNMYGTKRCLVEDKKAYSLSSYIVKEVLIG